VGDHDIRQSLPRAVVKPRASLLRFYRVGLAFHTAMICTIAGVAYSGMLPPGITVVPYYDKIMHFVLLGTWGFFLDGSLAHRAVMKALEGTPFVPRLGTAIALALATTEEIAQRLSPVRSSSWSDWVANTLGILLGSWLALRLTKSADVRHRGAGVAEGGAA